MLAERKGILIGPGPALWGERCDSNPEDAALGCLVRGGYGGPALLNSPGAARDPADG